MKHSKILLKCMKLSFFSILLQVYFIGLVMAGNDQQKNLSVKEVFITINLHDASLLEIFKEIEANTNFVFNYDDRTIKNNMSTVNVSGRKSVADILLYVSEVASVKFKQVNNNINVENLRNKYDKDKLEIILQTRTITGKVTSQEEREGLPGVNVIEKGTTNGTVTSVQGDYSITVSEGATLVFSSVGYTSEEIAIGNRSVIDLTMSPDIQHLDELVVIGYGTQQRRHLTGSIGTVRMEEVADRAVTDFGQALYGKVPGVTIHKSSGEPGGGQSAIQIRGIGSLSAAVVPLIVVDGIPMPDFDLYNISPMDIESIDILKDAASAAIYGSRGSNGVILITTKSGSRDKVQVNFNYNFTSQSIMRTVNSMGGPDYARLVKDATQLAWVRSGGDPNAPNTVAARGAVKYTWPEAFDNPETVLDTDWYDLIYRNAPMHQADLSLSGGDSKSVYYVSVGVLDQEGIGINTDYQRFSLNLRADTRVNNWLKLGGLVKTNYSNADRTGLGDTEINVNQYPRIFPVFNEDGYLGGPHNTPGYEQWNNLYSAVSRHPLRPSANESFRQVYNFIGNVFTEIEILPRLALRSSFSAVNRRTDNQNHALKFKYLRDANEVRPGSVSKTTDLAFSYNLENRIHYFQDWNSHHIDVVAGYEYNKRQYSFLSASRQNYDNDLIPHLAGGSAISGASDNFGEYALISMLGRVNYNYLGRYLASVSFRRDGSSRFGPQSKWGNFSSFSAGWHIGEEAFMQEIPFISNMTIRGSYGLTGNDGIGDYRWMSSLGLENVAIGNNLVSTYQPLTVPNPELRWERTNMFNFNLEVGFFNNRILFDGEIYNSISDGLLLNVPVPAHSGFTSQLQNIGEVKNKGVELSLTTRNISRSQFSWTTNTTFARNRGEITALGPENAPIFFNPPGIFGNWIGITHTVGAPPTSFYGLIYDGVFMNQAEVEAYEAEYPHQIWPGMARYRDINGDGVIDELDRTIIGNPEPDFVWAMGNTFKFRNLDFSFLFHGQVGGDLFDGNWRRSMYWHGGRNFNELANNRWRSEQEPGDGYVHAFSVDIGNTIEITPSSYFLQDFTYTRLKDITLGYTLPSELMERIGISRARFYLNATNLLTWQPSTAIDPENNFDRSSNSNPFVGIQQSSYPSAKTITLGVNLQL
jgi:TonB-dependent starch-binding outer membrane protein SusC